MPLGSAQLGQLHTTTWVGATGSGITSPVRFKPQFPHLEKWDHESYSGSGLQECSRT